MSFSGKGEIGALLRALDAHSGRYAVQCALRLAPLVFVRAGELAGAEWSEIDLEKAEWRIPAARMKMKQVHIVPLSRQTLAILRELHDFSGGERHVFPGWSKNDPHMHKGTLVVALRRMGYTREQMTFHGFRSMASTLLNE
ncbi:MAG: site-specific integrase, partial [Desulfovibrio sp.]|nr:site-specific integrase [Desulfovibrio sp.]